MKEKAIVWEWTCVLTIIPFYIIGLYTLSKSWEQAIIESGTEDIKILYFISYTGVFSAIYATIKLVEWITQQKLGTKILNYIAIFSPAIWAISYAIG